jgi:hypothetical protein
MRALQGILLVVASLAAACDKKPAPAAAAGSAAVAPAPAAAAGSATGSATGSAAAPAVAPTPADPAPAAATGKPYDGPTFTVTSTLSGPDVKTKDIDTDAGKTTMTMYAFTDPADDNVMQMVESNPITPVSKSATQKVLESSMEGMTENVHATVDSKKMITVGTDPMLDFSAHFTDEDGLFFMRGRVAMKNAKLFQVLAMGKTAKPSASAESFVTSFKLK